MGLTERVRLNRVYCYTKKDEAAYSVLEEQLRYAKSDQTAFEAHFHEFPDLAAQVISGLDWPRIADGILLPEFTAIIEDHERRPDRSPLLRALRARKRAAAYESEIVHEPTESPPIDMFFVKLDDDTGESVVWLDTTVSDDIAAALVDDAMAPRHDQDFQKNILQEEGDVLFKSHPVSMLRGMGGPRSDQSVRGSYWAISSAIHSCAWAWLLSYAHSAVPHIVIAASYAILKSQAMPVTASPSAAVAEPDIEAKPDQEPPIDGDAHDGVINVDNVEDEPQHAISRRRVPPAVARRDSLYYQLAQAGKQMMPGFCIVPTLLSVAGDKKVTIVAPMTTKSRGKYSRVAHWETVRRAAGINSVGQQLTIFGIPGVVQDGQKRDLSSPPQQEALHDEIMRMITSMRSPYALDFYLAILRILYTNVMRETIETGHTNWDKAWPVTWEQIAEAVGLLKNGKPNGHADGTLREYQRDLNRIVTLIANADIFVHDEDGNKVGGKIIELSGVAQHPDAPYVVARLRLGLVYTMALLRRDVFDPALVDLEFIHAGAGSNKNAALHGNENKPRIRHQLLAHAIDYKATRAVRKGESSIYFSYEEIVDQAMPPLKDEEADDAKLVVPKIPKDATKEEKAAIMEKRRAIQGILRARRFEARKQIGLMLKAMVDSHKIKSFDGVEGEQGEIIGWNIVLSDRLIKQNRIIHEAEQQASRSKGIAQAKARRLGQR